jgi:hypothetical protein
MYIDTENSGGTVASSSGSLSKVSLDGVWGTNFGFNSGGDNIIILQGTRAAPNFVFALRHGGTFASGGDCTNKNNTALPAGLALGSSAVQMASSQNQWHYNCSSTLSGTRASLLAAVCNNANWTSAGGQSWGENTCTFSVTDAYTPDGVIGITGAGCGCLSGCDLSDMGGPDCGSGVSGSCTSKNFFADIDVPAGCTYHVRASMRGWNTNCSASGADGDNNLRVDDVAGAKSPLVGFSNVNLTDNFTLTGPGTIRVSGRSNRADEIIAYGVIGSPCATCDYDILPVDLLSFSAELSENAVILRWKTASEENNAFFDIEKSVDGKNWIFLNRVNSNGNSFKTKSYDLFDYEPVAGTSYYRLKQVDFDGKFSYSKIVSVQYFSAKKINLECESNGIKTFLSVNCPQKKIQGSISVFDILGKEVFKKEETFFAGKNSFEFNLNKGVFLFVVTAGNDVLTKKIWQSE